MEKTNKHKEVLKHLRNTGSITSMEAIDLFGATRLSAIIFDLRKQGYVISTETHTKKDRYGNNCNFAVYKLEA